MHTMQSTLLVGSADWNPALLPKEEFRSRLEQMWRWCDPWSGGAIVYGSRSSHTELAYLTNFTPKLESALALIPNPGEPRLLVGGGVNMIAAARPLTWVEDVAPLRSPGKMVAEWVRNLAVPTRVLMIGGDAMPHAMHREIVDALGREVILQDAGDRMSLPMMHKSARELAAIRMACATLDAATATLAEARRSGAGVTAAILAAERAAYRRGAQDVRSLFSLDHGRTLRPFTAQVEQRIDPLQVYLAVRQAGYWAEGFVVLADQPNPALDAARAGLRAALAQAQAGTSYGNLATALVHSTGSRNPHPLLAEIQTPPPRRLAGDVLVEVGRDQSAAALLAVAERMIAELPPVYTAPNARAIASVGLSIREYALPIGRSDGGGLHDGEVLSLRAGAVDGASAAIVSAMIAVRYGGHELLWSTPGALP